MIIATAGHVDHGKTSLIKRLTGTDTDSLEEEKRRGLSINLGFAYRQIGETSLGFIDVPGHKRFINTMISGVSSIDMAMIIVAADDGPMPQTIEHVDILLTLGIKYFTLVISKIDKVEPARIQTVEELSLALLPNEIANDNPVFEISNTTGKGIADLQNHLDKTHLAFESKGSQGLFRQAVDRVFSLKGIGTVITGTVSNGEISVGESVLLQPQGSTVKVRDIHANNQGTKTAKAGQRCAINLSGDINKADINKGDWLIEPGAAEARDCFSAKCKLLDTSPVTLKHMSPIKLYIGARHIPANISFFEQSESNKHMRAGDERWVRFLLKQPACSFTSEHYLIRDDSESFTLGGGKVLDPFAARKGKASTRYLNYLTAMNTSNFIAAFEQLLFQQQQVIDLDRLRLSWNLSLDEAEVLLDASKYASKYKILESSKIRYALSEELFLTQTKIILDEIRNWHKNNAHESGIREKLLKENLAGKINEMIFEDLLYLLANNQTLIHSDGKIKLASFKPANQADEKEWILIKDSLLERGKQIPSLAELNDATKLENKKLNAALNFAIKNKYLYRINNKRVALNSTLLEFTEQINLLANAQSQFTAVDFKNKVGIGRNLAIELLEYFDSIRFTQRHGNNRIILNDNIPHELFKAIT